MIQVWARGSPFRVEKKQTARIKGIVSSSGYKSVSPQPLFDVQSVNLPHCPFRIQMSLSALNHPSLAVSSVNIQFTFYYHSPKLFSFLPDITIGLSNLNFY